MPLPTPLTAQTYSPSELSHLPPPTKYLFAHPAPQPTPDTLSTSHTFTSFNIYPTSETSLTINQFLHTAVHKSHLPPPSTSAITLGSQPFILGLNPDLHHFLLSVTLHQLNQAITDFLILLYHKFRSDSDLQSQSAMSHDLVPSLWRQVHRNLLDFPNGQPPAGPRAAILDHLVHISFLTPWRVDVFGAYLPSQRPAVPASSPPRHCPTLGRLMAKMFADWVLFSRLLCRNALGLPYSQAADAVERLARSGKGPALLHRVERVLREGDRPRSWLHRMPSELVAQRLIPWLIKRSCEMIAPARRPAPSFKSLLDMSARVLHELREEVLPLELEEETGEMVAALVGDGVGEVTLGERVGVGVLTRRVLEDGLGEGNGIVAWPGLDDDMDTGWYAGFCEVEQGDGEVYPLDEGLAGERHAFSSGSGSSAR